jgi:hypothetical protein
VINIDINIVRELKAQRLGNRAPDTPEQRSAKLLALKVITLVDDGRTLANTWGVYLFDSKLNAEPELRNKISVVIISGLLDTVQAKDRVIDAHKREAEERGFENIVAWCDLAKEWCVAAQGVLSLFSKEEQLFIQDCRNQWVHGWLTKTQQERFRVSYFNGEKFVTEKVDREEYFDLIKVPMVGVMDGNIIYQKRLEEVLYGFSSRLLNREMQYWKMVEYLNGDGIMNNACEQIYADIGVSWDPVLKLFPDELY